jgi:hypothetical protein
MLRMRLMIVGSAVITGKRIVATRWLQPSPNAPYSTLIVPCAPPSEMVRA